jgi:serine/threonine-protein kinase
VNKETIDHFEREAQAAAALNHPNIVTIHEIGEHEGRTFIAMEYVEGKTLREIIPSVRTTGPVAPTEAITIVSQICEGLAKAHQAGIVHSIVIILLIS